MLPPNNRTTRKFFVKQRPTQSQAWWHRVSGDFPVDFLAASVVAVVSAHSVAYAIKKLLPAQIPSMVVALLAVAALAVLARDVYRRRFDAHARGAFVKLAGLLLLLDLASIAGHAALPSGWWVVVYIASLLGAASVLHRRREVLTRIRALQVYRWMEEPLPVEATSQELWRAVALPTATDIIALLSVPIILPHVERDVCRFDDGQNPPVDMTSETSLAEAISRLDAIRPNWQQVLRGLEPHAGSIRRVYLIGSPSSEPGPALKKASPGKLSLAQQQSHGSHLYAEDCAAMLRLLLGPQVSVTICAPADFEDINGLDHTISKLVEEIHDRHAQRNDGQPLEVVVETTGALKSTSIAGAIATLRGRTKFQYVVTYPPFPVLLHDLRIDEPPQPG